MPLLTLFPWLSLITGRVWVYVALIGMAGSFFGGYWVKSKFEQAKQAIAINQARDKERDAVLMGNDQERGYLARAREKQEAASGEIEELRARLAKSKPCAVPVTRGMRGKPSVSKPAPDASRVQPTAPDVDTADARDVVLNCERNRLERFEPNAEQMKGMQKWYESLRRQYNR